eukprot:gb/GEZN01006897.1/.p1 GENE.gb/GEZN01006897.1/~~gb/GEZN01006897.1/.p1  ORF type:complete len:360 (+),score=40.68 gb/GEZN01006897.1/:204-1283(+)
MGGVCGSNLTAEQRRAIEQSDKLNRIMGGQKNEEGKTIKVLLLGTGESGKSTIFKQFQLIYDKGFSEFEKLSYLHVLRRNIVQSMQTLIMGVAKFNMQWTSPQSKKWADFFMDVDPLSISFWAPDLVTGVLYLWQQEPSIQEAYKRRSYLQLLDSAEYFFQNVVRIGAENYTPTEEDMVRARLRTSGIVEKTITIETVDFRFMDVGGQRNERRKWIHCFQGVTAIIFISAISEYDQMLYEDEKENRMLESIRVFDNICNNMYFTETAMILFLNKVDLFKEKITRVPLTKCFEQYTGDNSYEQTSEFVKDRFIEVNKRECQDPRIFTHFTMAIDRGNVRKVFEVCKLVILQRNLAKLGLA